MRRLFLRCVLVVVGSALALSCSAIESFDGLAGPPASDASALDAPTSTNDADAPGSDAGADALTTDAAGANDGGGDGGGAVIFSNGFETGCQDTTFDPYQAALTTSTIARTGSASCQVCFTSMETGTGYTLDQILGNSPPAVGAKVYGQAWVRALSGEAQTASIILRTMSSGGGSVDEAFGAPLTLSTSWQLVTTTLTPQKSGAAHWDYFVAAYDADGGGPTSGDCFLVDDVVITQLP